MATINDILQKDKEDVGQHINIASYVPKAPPSMPSVLAPSTSERMATPQIQATTPAANAKKSMIYSQMFDALNPVPTTDDLEKLRKRDKANRVISALGDGISAISNLYFTTKGAPSARLYSASDRYGKLYDDAVNGYRSQMKEYNKRRWDAYVKDIIQRDKDRNYDLNVRKAEDMNARSSAQLAYNKEKDKNTADRLSKRDAANDVYRNAQLSEAIRNNESMRIYRSGSLGVARQKAAAVAGKNTGKRETGTIQLYDRNGKSYPVYEKDWRYAAPQLVDAIEKATGTKLDLASDIGIGVTPLDKQLAYVSEHWADVPEAVQMVNRMKSVKNAGADMERRSTIGWDDNENENKIGW